MRWGSATVERCTFRENVAANGGAIATMGAVTVTGSTLVDNFAQRGGGGHILEQALIADTLVIDNTAEQEGGGLYLYGAHMTSALQDVTMRENKATTGDGGGLYVRGLTTLNRVTIDNNRSHGSGGGIYMTTYNQSVGSLTITNTTVYSNSARISGGGLYVQYPGDGPMATVAMTHTTIASNTVLFDSGGNLYNNQSAVSLASSIVAHGTAGAVGADCDGNPQPNFDSLGYNLETGTDCGFAQMGDQQNADPCWAPCRTTAARPTRWRSSPDLRRWTRCR